VLFFNGRWDVICDILSIGIEHPSDLVADVEYGQTSAMVHSPKTKALGCRTSADDGLTHKQSHLPYA